MGWLKRNLFFAIGGVVALGLLGGAGFYDYQSWGHNQTAFADLNEVYSKLTDAAKVSPSHPSPGNDKVDNIATANEQRKQLEAWISQTKGYFQPIDPIPANRPLSNESFGHALAGTIKQLQDDAASMNVQLPPQYPFSFTTDIGRLTFAGGLEPLSEQLGEVKAISEVLYGSGINALDGIQRYRASPDDANGPQTDYLDDQPVTNDMAVFMPYQITFRGFSPEIARVLEAFATSPHGFMIKTFSVQPAGAAAMTTAGPLNYNDAGVLISLTPAPGRGGLQTVLNEQLLRVTLMVYVVKLTPRN